MNVTTNVYEEMQSKWSLLSPEWLFSLILILCSCHPWMKSSPGSLFPAALTVRGVVFWGQVRARSGSPLRHLWGSSSYWLCNVTLDAMKPGLLLPPLSLATFCGTTDCRVKSEGTIFTGMFVTLSS